MTQSTLVDTPGSAPISSPRRPRKRPLLQPSDYERVFDVLETCSDARSLPDFKAQLVEGLSRTFDLRHVSFFSGATFRTIFNDPQPLTEGDTRKMFPEYRERWCQHDVFGTPAALRPLATTGVASLAEMGAAGPLPPPAAAYVRHFLVGTWGMQGATALRIELPGGHSGLVGLFDPEGDRLGPRTLGTLRLLSRQLSTVSRHVPMIRQPSNPLRLLSERQQEVATLVGQGLSNAEIAEALSLLEDSVKKYVSRVLSATGCQSRLELALFVRAQA